MTIHELHMGLLRSGKAFGSYSSFFVLCGILFYPFLPSIIFVRYADFQLEEKNERLVFLL
jgi:hypothetical protein